MFYSETVLSRRGPLGRVWLAAHMERKLSKSQTLQTDIEQSIDAIMGEEIKLMALRLSGQLLLGVVRIYSRKAKYLLDDCNEALIKIKMAFRPGVVDLTEEQLTVNKTAITLQANGLGLDLLLPDVDWDMDFEERPLQRQGHHQAHIDDITLRTTDDFQLGIDDPFDMGPTDGIGAQDFNDLDLGIHWGDEHDKSTVFSIEESVGVGRDANIYEGSIDIDLIGNYPNVDVDIFSQKSKSREVSEQPFSQDMDVDAFQDVDLADLGIGFEGSIPPIPIGDIVQIDSASRASSPLTEIPATPPPEDFNDILVNPLDNLEPRIAKQQRKLKDKKQIIDSVTEIQTGATVSHNGGKLGRNNNPLNVDTSNITSAQHFLPRSSIVMRLMEIREDPISYFLPTQTKADTTFYSCAPPGLTSELANLFIRHTSKSLSQKRRNSSPEMTPNKKARRSEIEIPRRMESHGLEGDNPIPERSLEMDRTFEFTEQPALLDDYQLDLPEFGQDMDRGRSKSVLSDRTRFSSLGPEATQDGERLDGEFHCAISVFDTHHPQQSQSNETEQEIQGAPETDKKGHSKNTIKALGLIRKELQPDADNANEVQKISFQQLSHKASRRAAASFFFELLVLSTRDCIQVSQATPFADIDIMAKPRLWEQQTHP